MTGLQSANIQNIPNDLKDECKRETLVSTEDNDEPC